MRWTRHADAFTPAITAAARQIRAPLPRGHQCNSVVPPAAALQHTHVPADGGTHCSAVEGTFAFADATGATDACPHSAAHASAQHFAHAVTDAATTTVQRAQIDTRERSRHIVLSSELHAHHQRRRISTFFRRRHG